MKAALFLRKNHYIRASVAMSGHNLTYLVLCLLLASCHQPETTTQAFTHVRTITDVTFRGKVVISNTNAPEGFKVILLNDQGTEKDRLIFRFPFYHVDVADVDGDGGEDILLGVVKETRFDPALKRRLFILRIENETLRPLWLGSRVCQELVMFRALPDGIIKTIEHTGSDKYAIGRYKWDYFGLSLINYNDDNLSYDDATRYLRE
jgi:hypothetical protein